MATFHRYTETCEFRAIRWQPSKEARQKTLLQHDDWIRADLKSCLVGKDSILHAPTESCLKSPQAYLRLHSYAQKAWLFLWVATCLQHGSRNLLTLMTTRVTCASLELSEPMLTATITCANVDFSTLSL